MKRIFYTIFTIILFTTTACKSTKQVQPSSDSAWTKLSSAAPENYGLFLTGQEIGNVSIIEAALKKTSGNRNSGFGLAFNYAEPQSNGFLPTYIRFEINSVGEYAVYSWDGKTFTDLVEPNSEKTAYLYSSGSINKGLGAENKLRIEQDISTLKYSLYINGKNIISDIEPMKKDAHRVRVFYSVGKQEEENFPDEPVSISYAVTKKTDWVSAEELYNAK